MKQFYKIALLVFTFSLVSCNENEDLSTIDEEVVIYFQERKIIGNNLFSITFSEILEDSRCPTTTDINCVWAGRILIEIEINDSDKKIIGLGNLLNPNSLDFYENLIEYNDYSIQLIKADSESITLKIKTI